MWKLCLEKFNTILHYSTIIMYNMHISYTCIHTETRTYVYTVETHWDKNPLEKLLLNTNIFEHYFNSCTYGKPTLLRRASDSYNRNFVGSIIVCLNRFLLHT